MADGGPSGAPTNRREDTPHLRLGLVGVVFCTAVFGQTSSPFGTVFIDPVGAIQLGAGVIPPTGTGVASIDVPSSASSYLGITFELQGLVNTLAGLRLTNARHVTLVSF
jgi:hypothetical protein